MFDFSKIEVSKVDKVDYTMDSEGRYPRNYWGKLVLDSINAVYFPSHGKAAYCVLLGFDDSYNGGGKLDVNELHRQIAYGQHDYPKPESKQSGPSSIIELKNAGLSVDDIIRLKNEGVL